MFILSVSGAGAQYGCYAYDDALTVSFTKAGPNGTKVELVPHAAHIVINVARFTSLMHIYYMMFLLLGFALIIFFTMVHTQRLFNGRYHTVNNRLVEGLFKNKENLLDVEIRS